MNHKHKLIIISQSYPILNIDVANHFLHDYIFSDEQIFGNLHLTINKLIMDFAQLQLERYNNNIYHENEIQEQLLSPSNYGITIVNTLNQKIEYMGFQDPPACLNISFFEGCINKMKLIQPFNSTNTVDNRIIQYTEKNLLKVLNKKTQEKYSIEEFFGTTDIKKITTCISSRAFAQHSQGIIKDIENIYDYSIIPHNLNASITGYENNQANELYQSLEPYLKFKPSDTQAWCQFLGKHGEIKAGQKIKEYAALLNEKQNLENAILSVSSTNRKLKL